MFIVENYATAIFFCVITMICWGSWANTQKLATQSWRFELFYWDYVAGILVFSILFGLTAGSIGTEGRSFMADLRQADPVSLESAFAGGIIFNAANILFSAAIAVAGMAVAFPIGIGIALVFGVLLNYINDQRGNPVYLFAGVAFIVLAILLNAAAYRRAGTRPDAIADEPNADLPDTVSRNSKKVMSKGIVLSLLAGVLMSFFYRFIAASMDLHDFRHPAQGKMTPYTAVFIFSTGIFVSNFIFNTVLMRRPVEGLPVSYRDYFGGHLKTHLVGLLGGLIWGLGNSLNLLASGKAGPAISYGLGQGATLVAAAWGVFIWKEFSPASKTTRKLIAAMFLCFIAGIGLIMYAGI